MASYLSFSRWLDHLRNGWIGGWQVLWQTIIVSSVSSTAFRRCLKKSHLHFFIVVDVNLQLLVNPIKCFQQTNFYWDISMKTETVCKIKYNTISIVLIKFKWFTYKWIIIIRFFSVNQKHTDQPKSKFQTNYSWAGYTMNSSTTYLTDLFNSSLKQVDQSAYRINTHLLNYMLSLFSEKSVSKLNMFCLSKLANWLSIVHVYECCQVD